MKLSHIGIGMVVIFFVCLGACKKNTLSPIPVIKLINSRPDSIKGGNGLDTFYITFSLQDGDADLGNDQSGTSYDIYLKDARFDTGYTGYFFPSIDQNAENPSVGLQGTCTLKQLGALITPRGDSLHTALGDTTHFELYIMDRAGHASNHITTGNLYIRP